MQSRAEKYKLNITQINELLNKAENAVLATVNTDSTPYAVPVHFVYSEGKIFIHGGKAGQKMENITANPAVCFTAYESEGYLLDEDGKPCKTNTKYQSIVISGKASVIQDAAAKNKALKAIVLKYTPHLKDANMPESAVNATVVIQIDVDKITGKYYG